jgi:hypothetical protein
MTIGARVTYICTTAILYDFMFGKLYEILAESNNKIKVLSDRDKEHWLPITYFK